MDFVSTKEKIKTLSVGLKCWKCEEDLIRVKKSHKNVSLWQSELTIDKGHAFICPQKCRI